MQDYCAKDEHPALTPRATDDTERHVSRKTACEKPSETFIPKRDGRKNIQTSGNERVCCLREHEPPLLIAFCAQ